MIVTNFLSSTRRICKFTLLLCTVLLAACERSEPSSVEIKDYIENYQIVHDLKVASMTYDTEPEQGSQFGSIQVSGQLELRESLYVEDEGNSSFRKNVAKMLRRNRFSEREINHDIYDRIVRASARVPGNENEYYTFLNVKHEPGLAINFSANLIYKTGNDGFILDGPVRHAKLLGSRITKFSNPVLDDAALVQTAVENVLSEQTRYRELMKESKALLSRLWDNDFGVVVWNRKVPYLGNENLSPVEQLQLRELDDWRGVFHISNIKPVQFRTAHASNFFELGSYTTEGVATCLRQTGFIDELAFLKSDFDQYCEYGKQYPVQIKFGSALDDTNEFVATVEFAVNGTESGQFSHDSHQFKREHNELARYSDQQHLTFLTQSFDIKDHSRPIFSSVETEGNNPERLSLKYAGTSKYPVLIDDETVIETVQVVEQRQPISETTEKVSQESPDLPNATQTGARENDQVATEVAKVMTNKELVKEIQIELKRLGVYSSIIDGVAGNYTYWGMAHVQKQLGKNEAVKPSPEFLALLRDTPTGSIATPETPYSPSAPAPAPAPVVADDNTKEKKETLAGKALKGTGRAIGNATRWVGNKFRKKED